MSTRDVAFMVMPFGDKSANDVYQQCTKPILESVGFRPLRADEIFGTKPVFDDIVTGIEQASIVVVDISGSNPNCFYELGMAHMIKQTRTIIITHDSYETVPFDISHFRIIRYQDSIKGKDDYESEFKSTISSVMSGGVDLYRSEFKSMMVTLECTNQRARLYMPMALAKTNSPVVASEPALIEGNRLKTDVRGNFRNVQDSMSHFIELGYMKVINGKLVLTEKGQIFVHYLDSKGYVVDKLNDEVFTEGHVGFFERMSQQHKDGKDEVNGQKGSEQP